MTKYDVNISALIRNNCWYNEKDVGTFIRPILRPDFYPDKTKMIRQLFDQMFIQLGLKFSDCY